MLNINPAVLARFGITPPAVAPLCPSSTIDPHLAAGFAFFRQITGPTVIVLDNANMLLGSASSRHHDFVARVDIEAVLQQCCGDELVGAFAAVSFNPDARRGAAQLGFYAFLQRQGVKLLGSRSVLTGAGLKETAIVDAQVRDVIRSAADRDDVETVVILSGDGGMTNAVRYVRHRGKKVIVLAWSGSLHPALAQAATASATLEEFGSLLLRHSH